MGHWAKGFSNNLSQESNSPWPDTDMVSLRDHQANYWVCANTVQALLTFRFQEFRRAFTGIRTYHDNVERGSETDIGLSLFPLELLSAVSRVSKLFCQLSRSLCLKHQKRVVTPKARKS